MKRLSLRVRYTLITSLFLLISCTVLTLCSNISANNIMVDAYELYPSIKAGQSAVEEEHLSELSGPMIEVYEPAVVTSKASYQLFRKESIIATILIVLIGSAATYFASGYVLKPITTLSQEIKKRNVSNFSEALPVPSSSDEIQELTVSFNQLLSEVQHSFQLQKQFSADAAHELRTPLAVMQTKLDVFAMSGDGSDKEQTFVKTLQIQLERLTELIENLLWFSRDLPLEQVEPVPLLPLLQDVADELSDVARQKGIQIELHGADCTVKGQDSLLERVFYNLLENAIKYSPENTAVSVEIVKQETKTVVSVKDHGEGIPEEYREEIFEPFFRVDKSRSRAIGGSGLGLAVCKKILERHSAGICVLPNDPTGSIFQVTFQS